MYECMSVCLSVYLFVCLFPFIPSVLSFFSFFPMLLVLLDAINREADADIDNRFSYDGKQDQLKKQGRMQLHDVYEEYICTTYIVYMNDLHLRRTYTLHN